MERMSQNLRQRVGLSLSGGGTESEVCRLRLHLVKGLQTIYVYVGYTVNGFVRLFLKVILASPISCSGYFFHSK